VGMQSRAKSAGITSRRWRFVNLERLDFTEVISRGLSGANLYYAVRRHEWRCGTQKVRALRGCSIGRHWLAIRQRGDRAGSRDHMRSMVLDCEAGMSIRVSAGEWLGTCGAWWQEIPLETLSDSWRAIDVRGVDCANDGDG